MEDKILEKKVQIIMDEYILLMNRSKNEVSALLNVKINFDYQFSLLKLSKNVKLITYFSLSMNWLSWYFYDKGDEYKNYMNLFSKLYYEVNGWCYDNLNYDELRYYYKETN